MRVLVCTFSAVLLSGCSWMGIGGHAPSNAHSSHAKQNYGVQYAQAGYGARGRAGPCQITAPTQPIPRGCRPEQVTLSLAQQGGYQHSQGGQYATGGYGSHTGQANSGHAKRAKEPRLKKPWLRGSLGLEIDHSVSGNLYNPGISSSVAGYNRLEFAEGFSSGSIGSGEVTTTTYTSIPERIASPEISFDDVYTAPLKVSGGLEVILGKHATVFANAGYVRSEGKKGGGAQIIDELRRITRTDSYYTDPESGPVGTLSGSSSSTSFVPNETVATFEYEFNDYERVDLQAGGRYYFSPILQDKLDRTVTPFVSASGGASYVGETTVTETQRQRFMQRAFEDGDNDFYDVNFGTRQQIHDAQWVPYGALRAGVEWQVTPKTALAFETGVKYQGGRDFSDGTSGDDNISIPFGIRGSYNF